MGFRYFTGMFVVLAVIDEGGYGVGRSGEGGDREVVDVVTVPVKWR